MICVPGQAAAVAVIAARHPGLRRDLDLLARPVQRRGAAAFADLDDVLALAAHPGVAVNATALPCDSQQESPFRELHDPLRCVRDAFGPRRILWGTDDSRLLVPYRDALRRFTDALDFLTPDDRGWPLRHAACEWLGWRP